MSETPTEEQQQAAVEGATQGNPAEDALGDAGKKALDAMKAERNEAAKRAKALERELEQVRQASMSEAEKAVAEAEQRGRTTAASEFGKRLARSEIRATAADASADLEGVFDYLDLGRFVSEGGEPDTKAIKAFIDGLPKKATTPSFDGGTRGTARAGGDMNQIIRRAAGHAG
jgi:hypothetical protein